MQLRWKIPLVVLLFVGFYALAFAVVFRTQVRPSFDDLDASNARDSLDRITELIDREGRSVDGQVVDNATWDETYRYIEDRNERFIPESMTPQTFASRGIDFAWVANSAGEVLWSWPDGAVPFARSDFAAMTQPIPPGETHTSGLVSTPQGLAIVGISEVHDTNLARPSRGWLLFGRMLTTEALTSLGEAAPVPFTLHAISGDAPTRLPIAQVDKLEDGLLHASKPVLSLDGQPVAVARIMAPRSVAQKGESLERTTFVIMLAAGVFVAALLALVLRLLLVNPLTEFGSELRRIRSGIRDARLTYTADDELGRLVREINATMDSLRTAERGRDAAKLESKELEERVQARTRALSDALARLRDEMQARTAVEKLRETDAHQQQALRLQQVGRLAGGVAHDFNNSLQAIRGCAEFLASDPRHDVAVSEEAKMIVRESDRAAGLVRQLLAFSSRGPHEPTAVDLGPLVEEVASLLSRTARRRHEIGVLITAVNRVVVGDAHQIRSAVVNLALNADDAMPDGGKLVLALSDVRSPPASFSHLAPPSDDRLVCLSVTDNGVGMGEETKIHLFEPFFTTKPVGRGSGLGLASVFGIARQHQAGVDVRSEVGLGTTVSLFFRASGAAVVAAPEETPMPARGHQRVLFVDDEPALCRIAARVLRGEGYTVGLALDGVEALEHLERFGPFDLMVLDLMMPRLDGYATFARVRALYPELPVIFQSGGSLDSEKDQSIKLDLRGVLPKPYSAEALVRAVARALSREGEPDGPPEHT